MTEHSDVIPVARGVTFMATANIGTEYTATKVLDKAISSRFPVKVEMEPLSKKDEIELLNLKNPDATDEEKQVFVSICEIAEHTRKQFKKEDGKITTFIPTGAVIEMAELISDGFELPEIAEVAIYPDYSPDGGADSERTYIKQLVQKYIKPTSVKNPINDPTKIKVEDTEDIPF